MKDIAAMLGVSVATVSRALKDNPSISREQREKIKKFASEHHYFPNVIAEQLRNSKKSAGRVIGVIVPQFIHYYFSSVLSGIEQEASRRGYRILVAQSNELHDREVEICKSFYQNKVCGIIVSQAKDTVTYGHFSYLLDNGVPLVFYDRICAGINTSRVVVDDYQGSMKAVSHLIESGCKRVAFFGTSTNMEIGKNRLNGYKDALYGHGMQVDDCLICFCDNREDAERLAPKLLTGPNRPDGFFAVNDETAIGILYAAKHMGLRVPEDVSVCGFTNSYNSLACDPMLTTVEQRGVQVGIEAAGVLIDTVEGKYDIHHVEKRIVKTRLVLRGTTRNPADNS
jgi:LacI family transcriptional regulator